MSGCERNTPEISSGKNEKLMFNTSAYHNQLKFAFVSNPGQVFRNSMKYIDTMYYFYLRNNFDPVFIKSFEDEGLVFSLLEILKAADSHGLNPEWYLTPFIEEEYVSAVTGDSIYAARYEHLANTEILLANAVVKYAWHLRYGVVNPKEIYPDTYYLPLPDSASKDLFEPLRQSDVVDYLYKIQPKSKRYTDLQRALKEYMKYGEVQINPIPVPVKKIEPGNVDSLLIPITERLITLGYIDTSTAKVIVSSLYDSLLVKYIKEFQLRNGLIDDAVIGKATVEKLNISPLDNIEKIKLNLERFRWTNYSDSSEYILINIPDFRLYVMEGEEEKFDIKVCTGKRRSANFQALQESYLKNRRYKPDDWETPNMTGQISHLVLNPTWTVPVSIIKEEIASGVRKDSLYLQKKNFKVYKDGQSVNPASIPSSEFLRYSSSYRVVQDAGPGNALGKIKFMFNNPFGIYLHDTPTRAPFNQSNRAVSHGCVRVEKPIQLAEYLLKNHTLWNVDYLKLEIGQPVQDNKIKEDFYSRRNILRRNSSYGRTTEVKLEKKIPVIIDYYTAWVDKEGKLNFRDDVYNREKILAEKLFQETLLKDALVASNQF